MSDYWHRQTKDAPLFPDLLWSRPEQVAQAGKLLIVGGNLHGFAAPAAAFAEADRAGIGVSRVLLPQSLQKTVGRILQNGEYAPSTPSGSFARSALSMLLEMSYWADATLLAGDFGRNSETVILLEQYLQKYSGLLALTKDSVDYFLATPQLLFERENTTLILSFAQLQKLVMNAHSDKAFTFEMDFIRLVDQLHELSASIKASIIVKHLDTIFVAFDGQVSTTKLDEEIKIWRVKAAAHAIVWELQNPSKIFESLTASVL
jgi:NAD(P)H-hydrate repair Nnr-like enzyme with NAD(P)H-hydrate dehydratase domain